MALNIGYNPDAARESIRKVIAAYNELIDAIGDGVQIYLVNNLADKWACNEAVMFFRNFKARMDSLNTSVDNIFENVVNSMNSAAKEWSKATLGSVGSAGVLSSVSTVFVTVPFTKRNKKISIDVIKENINGDRGVNDRARSIMNGVFHSLNQSTEQALNKASSAVQHSGFLRISEAQSLLNTLNFIKIEIKNAVAQIYNESKTKMDASFEKYETLSRNVSNAFQGKES